jgi:hypothetical protein
MLIFKKILKLYQRFNIDKLTNKVSASQPRDNGFEPYLGHDPVSSYGTSSGWFQEKDSEVINTYKLQELVSQSS